MFTKGFIHMIVITLLALLVGVGGYITFSEFSPNSTNKQPSQSLDATSDNPINIAENNLDQLSQNANSDAPKEPDVSSTNTTVNGDWKTYNKTNQWFGYATEYPATWSLKEVGTGEIGSRVYFMPPNETSEQRSIELLVINYKKTPPPPVWYTYTTLRTVRVGNTDVLIQKRDPDSNQYIARITKDDYTMEFRFASAASSSYASVFDHIVSTFVWTK